MKKFQLSRDVKGYWRLEPRTKEALAEAHRRLRDNSEWLPGPTGLFFVRKDSPLPAALAGLLAAGFEGEDIAVKESASFKPMFREMRE